jgi:hypothetical protein
VRSAATYSSISGKLRAAIGAVRDPHRALFNGLDGLGELVS